LRVADYGFREGEAPAEPGDDVSRPSRPGGNDQGQAYGSPTIKTPDGVEHNWPEELAAKVASLQREGG